VPARIELTEALSTDATRALLYGPADEIEAILKNTLQKLQITPAIKRPAADSFIPASDQHILTWRSEDEENLLS